MQFDFIAKGFFFFFCILLFLFASLQGTSKEIPKYSTFLVLHFYI